MRQSETYNGEMMVAGKSNEDIIMAWLRAEGSNVFDYRDFRWARKGDVDCGIETADGSTVLAEIKSDKWIREEGNLCFEHCRINHFGETDNLFYLGWGWRSRAKKLICRNPLSYETFIFSFEPLRHRVAEVVGHEGKCFHPRINITETDDRKTTFNFLIPMSYLKDLYQLYGVPQ